MCEMTDSTTVPELQPLPPVVNEFQRHIRDNSQLLATTEPPPKPEPLLADPEFDLRGVAWNPLCDAATPLIGLVIRLRRLGQHDDVPALYLSVSNQITT
ncbi:type IVB secretion system protein IcmH/DotU, partial [Pseudomonas atacamensis]